MRRLTLFAIALATLLPLLPLIVWSFAHSWFFPNLLPQEWGWQAWSHVFSPTSKAGTALVTSAALALVVVMLCILIGLPAARALGMHRFRGRAVVEWAIMAPLIVPTLVVAMGIHVLFIRYGLADTFAGVALVHLVPALPYFVLVMTGVFATYDPSLEMTARTLGAGPVRAFWHVTLPAILPGLMVASLFTFLVSWSQYITTLLIGGGRVVTLPMVLFPFISSSNHSHAAAISIVFVIPALVALFATARVLTGRSAAVGGLGRL